MVKKLTLNETWRLCLKMWRWIAKQVKEGTKKSTDKLKLEWLKNNWAGKKLYGSCFFCEYLEKHPKAGNACPSCPSCPAVMIDPKFSCMGTAYDYEGYPIKFYNKLVSLNRKRNKK